MASLSYDERECKEFLQKFENGVDPTWGFYVYGTYTRPQGQANANADNDDDKAQRTPDDARFQAVLSKLHAHAADNLRYRWPALYNERMIGTLRLEPAAYLPGASLADACMHFRQHYAQIIDPEKEFDPEYEASLNPEKFGAKYNWCLVIDNEALQSIESAPEPIGLTPPEGVPPRRLSQQSRKAFIKLLSVSYTTIEEQEILGASGRGGTGHRIEWNGWLKFSPTMLKNVWRETDSGEIETYFRDTDTLVEIS